MCSSDQGLPISIYTGTGTSKGSSFLGFLEVFPDLETYLGIMACS